MLPQTQTTLYLCIILEFKNTLIHIFQLPLESYIAHSSVDLKETKIFCKEAKKMPI
jgi:hypothetical protein